MRARRCPNCGGLVAPGVEFCQQCFYRIADGQGAAPKPVSEPAAEGWPPQQARGQAPSPRMGERPVRASSGRFRRSEDGTLSWSCPACDRENPIEAMACGRCGTPFKRIFGEEETAPLVEPQRATRLSLAFPGLGHHALGRTADGLSRAVLFLWTLGTAVALLLIRRGQGLGRFAPMVIILGASAAALYLTSAIDAGRIARKEDPLLSSRTLLYGGAGIMLLIVGLMMMQVLGAQT